jgi:hypothetical protein
VADVRFEERKGVSVCKGCGHSVRVWDKGGTGIARYHVDCFPLEQKGSGHGEMEGRGLRFKCGMGSFPRGRKVVQAVDETLQDEEIWSGGEKRQGGPGFKMWQRGHVEGWRWRPRGRYGPPG